MAPQPHGPSARPSRGGHPTSAATCRPEILYIHHRTVRITHDPDKRSETLKERDLDFEDAATVFASDHVTRLDNRQDYGEDRANTAGKLKSRMVVITWTPRGDEVRVISMRYCHEREAREWEATMGRSG